MTVQKPDRTKTKSTEETLRLTLDQLTPEDNLQDDTDYNKSVRRQADQSINMINDKEFMQGEVRQVIERLKQK